jgi:hypothetical protein
VSHVEEAKAGKSPSTAISPEHVKEALGKKLGWTEGGVRGYLRLLEPEIKKAIESSSVNHSTDPVARATVDSFSRNSAGKTPSNFPHASRVSCSELGGCDDFVGRYGRLL